MFTSDTFPLSVAAIKSENEMSLFQLLEKWLERTPFLSFDGFDFWEQYSVAVKNMLSKEKQIIESNPNYDKVETEYHLLVKRLRFYTALQTPQFCFFLSHLQNQV